MKIHPESSVLILGQHLTSRTEAIRDYLVDKVDSLCILGVASYSVNKKDNHAFYYKKGSLESHRVFRHKLLGYFKKRELSIPVTFITYIIDLIRSLVIFRKRFDYFIGISHFFGFIGVFLKSSGVCRKFVYYTIDYYVPHTLKKGEDPVKGYWWFERQLLRISIYFDKMAVACADEIWDISGRIAEGRFKASNFDKGQYKEKQKIVPLGYSPSFYRNKGLREIKRNSIVFVGVVLKSQGLELILNVIPELSKLTSGIEVRVIGTGPYLEEFKKNVSSKSLGKYFKFYGFIDSVDEMLDTIASCAVGVSVWDDKSNKILNAYYGDPGKTKLYSVCGLPVVVSDITLYSKAITSEKAGIAIKYKEEDLLDALKKILLDPGDYAVYKENAVIAGYKYCSSEEIFKAILN